MLDYVVPLVLFFCCAVALGKRENAYDLMLQGAGDGLKLLLRVVGPVLIGVAIAGLCGLLALAVAAAAAGERVFI